jgi:hypothetical protein
VGVSSPGAFHVTGMGVRLVLELFLTGDLNEVNINSPGYRLSESHKILRRRVEPPYEASPPCQ